MLVQMDEQRIATIEDIVAFLNGTIDTPLILHGSKDEIYSWVEHTLVKFGYLFQNKKEKGYILRYIERLSGYSRQQITRLVKQQKDTGYVRRRHRTAKGFEKKYTHDDIVLLAKVDRVMDGVSGTTVKAFCQRMFIYYEDLRFAKLCSISASHIYNLRKTHLYQRCRRKFTTTKNAAVTIGERCKPQPNGKPGFLRVDSVHQGDKDGKKGVYHVNAVDEVTQWEVIVTVERITDQFMVPALSSILDQFPFKISGFHSDNGSEYINQRVAALLNESLIQLTKSRPRHSNDNALAESKNNSVVRKTFGYIHIPQKHAELIDEFNRNHLNPCMNFHRPCHFPTIEINDKGKQIRRYIQQDMKTPFEKLASLDQLESYLKPGVSIAALEKAAKQQSDLDAWEAMQKARTKLFESIFGLSLNMRRN